MALLIKPVDLQGVQTTLIKLGIFLKIFNLPYCAEVRNPILLYESHIGTSGWLTGVYRGRIFAKKNLDNFDPLEVNWFDEQGHPRSNSSFGPPQRAF